MVTSIRPGDVLAGRYRLEDLLGESRGGRFWRAHDRVLDRYVAVHVLSADDERAPELLDAARRSAAVLDRCVLRVLDADRRDDLVFVVNEWGDGASLDIVLADQGPLDPRQAAWVAAEVGASLAAAHEAGIAHGRLTPENVLLDHNGHVRLIGLGVEAALWGLPQGRTGVDIVDLAAVLYAGLTGRWAGVSQSKVASAPVEHGSVLRPRQVRAGIPRPLDSLCDQVINPDRAGAHAKAAYDLSTARGIADYLRAFVGDSGDLPAVTARQVRRLRTRGPVGPGPEAPAGVADLTAEETSEHPAYPPDPDPAPDPAPDPTGDPAGDPAAAQTWTEQPEAIEQPTELGMPIFDDESDDVSWLKARANKPAPPPPFEAHPERPLFAPDPAPGEPVRRPRPGAAAPTGEYWPWETGTGAPVTTGTGSGPLYLDEEELDESRVPGRSWLRLGMVILATLLLVLTVLVGINLFRGRAPLALGPGAGSSTSPSGSTSASTPGTEPLAGLIAYALDPQGDPPEENPRLAKRAVDGDPTSDWHTSTYKQNFGPGGLKTGVGLVVDVGEVRALQDLTVDLVGGPTGVTVFVTKKRPEFVRGLKPAVKDTVDDTLQVSLDGASGRYVVIWLTSLPRVGGGFSGGVAEVGITA